MESENLIVLITKTLFLVLLFIYFLLSVLIARQVFLMNKAIKTKMKGCLNCLSLVHIFLVLLVLMAVVIVK